MNCIDRTVVSRKKINAIFAALLFFFTNVLGKQFKVKIDVAENIFELTHDLTFRPINADVEEFLFLLVSREQFN